MSKIILGKSGRENLSVDLTTLLRTRLLAQANSGGGKSWLLRVLAEQLFGKVQTVIIDREGEFASLREKFGYLHVGEGGDTPADLRSARLLAEKILELNASAIIDLYEAFRKRPLDRRAYVADFLETLIDAPKKLWRDMVIITDEAHQFCPEGSPKTANKFEREIVARCKDAMVSVATVGRKRGYCAIWVTQRLAKLDKDASAELMNRLVGMTFEDVDVDRAADLMSVSRDEKASFKKSLRDLDPGHFYGFGRAISKERVLLKVRPVITTHPEPGSAKHAAAPPPAPEKIRALLPKLKDLPQAAETKAKTEKELRKEIVELRARLAKAAKETVKPVWSPKAAPPAPKPEVKIHELPVVSAEDAKRIRKVLVRLEGIAGKLSKVGDLERAILSINKELGGKLSDAVQAAEKLLKAPVPRPTPQKPVMRRDEPRRGVPARPPVRPRASAPAENGDEKPLLAGERKMLEVLAIFPDGRSESQLGALAGYAPGGGTFGNYRRRLLRDSYMEPRGDGGFIITQKGLDYFDGTFPQGPSTPEELRDMWHAKLLAGERKMHQVLLDVYPEELTLEELGERSGYESGGGTFGNYKRKLTRNAIAVENRGKIKAADCFFEAVETR